MTGKQLVLFAVIGSLAVGLVLVVLYVSEMISKGVW